MKSLFSLLLSIFIFQAVLAQDNTKYFDPQPENFMKQLNVLFKENARDELEVFYKKLEKEYKEGKISESQQSKMVDILNIMYSRKMQVYPYYKNFIEATGNSYKSGYSEQFIDRWYNFVKGVLVNSKKGNNKDFNIFIDFSNDLFTINALVSENSKSYTIEKRELSFRYVDKHIIASVPKTNLRGFFKTDTIVIWNTSGEYNIMERTWKGNEGEMNWLRVGLPKETVSATFGRYTIDMNKPSYSIDSALLTYPEYFPKPVYGRIDDKITKEGGDFTTLQYPQFTSYIKTYPFNNKIANNIRCSGGFKIKGNSIIVGAEDGTPVNVEIYAKDGITKIFSAEGSFAIFQKENFINMDKSRITIYMGKDSIYHPSSSFKYDVQKRELRIVKEQDGSGKARYRSSFHKMSFDAEILLWNIDEDFVNLKMLSGKGKNAAKFISDNNFDQQTFNLARTAAATNDPLTVLSKMAETNPTGIPVEDYVKSMGPAFSVSAVLPMLFSLEKDGFINYSSTNKTITINKDYTNFYIKANAKKTDYDILRFSSLGQNSIGKYNIKNKNLEINSVVKIPMNDSANVMAFPNDTSKVVISNNRKLEFDGKIMAGRMDFYTAGSKFDYDSFNVKSDKIEMMRIHIPDKVDPATGADVTVKVLKSSLEKFKGDIQINSRFNRSGMQSARKYPTLKTTSNAYVYYDNKNIYNGRYDREDFYFEVAPFKKDSLQFFDKDALFYEGKLVSAKIFQPFPEKLRIQPDLSLGFITKTTESGFANYQNKGSFNGTIKLSNSGLIGQGVQKYMTASLTSDSILYFPDQTNLLAKKVESKEQKTPTEFPQYTTDSALIEWRPYTDTMLLLSHKRHPFNMFNNSTEMFGLLVLTNKGLTGSGYLDFDEAKISSKAMIFKSTTMNADTASMEIKSLGDKLTFKTPNVKAKMDFVTKIGDFKSNANDIATDFAYNQYKAEINEFKWDINQKILTFKSPEGSKGSKFTSTHPDQDSLTFLARKAEFSLVTSIIKMDGVDEIQIADSKVFPNDGKVTLQPKAKMETLNNATIEGDTANNYHKFTNAKLDIHGKNDMIGYGEYVLKVNDKDHNVKLNSIRVTKKEVGKGAKKKPIYNYTIEGTGKVDKNQNLQIYRNVDYYGDVTIAMNKKYPLFNGKQRIKFDNPPYKTPWFDVNNEINVEELQLNKKELIAEGDQNLYTGFMIDRESNTGIYTNIMAPLRTNADQTMFDANGIIKHSKSDNVYIFGDSAKILTGARKGNKIRYSDSSGTLSSEGYYNPNLKMGGIPVVMGGSMDNNLKDSSYKFNGSVGFNITLDPRVMNALVNVIAAEFGENLDINYNKKETKNSLIELFHPKDVAAIEEDLAKSGTIQKGPKYTPFNLVLSDVIMDYHNEDMAFRSKAEFGLSMVGGRPVNKKVNGFFEYGYGEYYDYFNLYFKAKNREWVFITYADGILGMLSSNEAFNSTINQIEPRKRIVRKSPKEYYTYSVAGDYDANAFTKRMAKGGKYNEEEKRPKEDKDKLNVDEKDLKNATEFIEKTPDQAEIERENARQDSIIKALELKNKEQSDLETKQYEEAEKKAKEEAQKKLEEEEKNPTPAKTEEVPTFDPDKEQPKETPKEVTPTPAETPKTEEAPKKEETPKEEAPKTEEGTPKTEPTPEEGKLPEETEKETQKQEEIKEEKEAQPENKEEPKSLFDKYF